MDTAEIITFLVFSALLAAVLGFTAVQLVIAQTLWLATLWAGKKLIDRYFAQRAI